MKLYCKAIERTTIIEEIKSIIHEVNGLLLDYDQHLNENIFGHCFNLSARNYVYVVYKIEKIYNITFHYTDFDKTEFYTVEGLADLVLSKLN